MTKRCNHDDKTMVIMISVASVVSVVSTKVISTKVTKLEHGGGYKQCKASERGITAYMCQ